MTEPDASRLEELDRLYRQNLKAYCATLVRIKAKDGTQQFFKFNRAQRHVDELLRLQEERTGRIRVLILKARQVGISTYIGSRFYKKTTMNGGQRTYILTHEDPATQNLFGMAKRVHDNMDPDYRPATTTDNAYEMDFGGIDSGYRVGTAKNVSGLGRSSTIQNFHGSEVAFWARADSHFGGVMQAVPKLPRTEVILESTANGVGGVFYEQWQLAESGKSEFLAIFIPWFWAEEYRQVPNADFKPSSEEEEYAGLFDLDAEQVCWMHFTNIELGGDPGQIGWHFRQEYPATAAEAFQTSGQDNLIKQITVLKARKAKLEVNEHAAKVMGVDVARGGKDKTRLLSRQGRILGGFVNETIDTDNLMKVASRVVRLIEKHDIQMTFIDITNMQGVYDRCLELGYGARVRGVNFGAGANNEIHYKNKRAEMWGELAKWLKDEGGADIPDDDVIHRHLCAPGYDYESDGVKMFLEPKKLIKKRLGFSPDGGDAAALTFAETVVAPHTQVPGWRAEMEREARQPLNWMTR